MNKIEIRDIIAKMSLHEKVMLCMGKNSWRTQDYPQYGIPSILVSDGTNGIRFQKDSDKAEVPYFDSSLQGSFDSPEALANTNVATCYPCGSAMACSWDKALMAQMGVQLAKECKAKGINVLLGPGMNIRRHPLTARNFEYYSEDPCLSGDIAAALVNGVQSEHVGTSVKHFVAHNSDDRRTRVDVTVEERALREIYLSGFERVVKKAHPATIMTCYNKINGIETNENSHILRDIVRDEWGFDGAYISDWGSAKDASKSTVGGLDLQMPCSMISAAKLEKDISEGRIDEALLDERAEHVLQLVFEYAGSHEGAPESDKAANHALAVEAAKGSMVLLKNEGALLPLHAGKAQKVAIIGHLAKAPLYVGSGCAIVRTDSAEIPYDEIVKLCGSETVLTYAPGYYPDGTTDEEMISEAVNTAKAADVVLVFAGSYLPGESDMYNRRFMDIEEGHQKVLEAVSAVNPQTAVLLFEGDVTVMPWIRQVRAVIDAWYGGEGMGSALAAVLFGQANPSGKLAATIPVKEEDTPAYLSFHQNPYQMFYGEGIYVGYRYYDKKKVEPLFPFGHGLSYTTFDYDNLRIVHQDEDVVKAAVEITNTGSMAGSEVVQCYISAVSRGMERPVRELKAFEKIALEPGETKTVTFELCARDFMCFDEINNEWVTDTDVYMIEAAASSRDIRHRAAVKRPVTRRPRKYLDMDCGFYEMFENEVTTKMFFDFAVAHGLLPKEMATEETKGALLHTFWAVRAYLDMNAHGMVTTEMIDDLITRMNEALSE